MTMCFIVNARSLDPCQDPYHWPYKVFLNIQDAKEFVKEYEGEVFYTDDEDDYGFSVGPGFSHVELVK